MFHSRIVFFFVFVLGGLFFYSQFLVRSENAQKNNMSQSPTPQKTSHTEEITNTITESTPSEKTMIEENESYYPGAKEVSSEGGNSILEST